MFVFWFFSLFSLVVAIENGSGTSSRMTSPGGGNSIQALLTTQESMKRMSSARALEETSYDVGTYVADYFVDEGGWFTGTILKVDGDTYTIQWSDGKTEDYDADDMDEIVDNYDSKAYDSNVPDEHEYSYKVGTKVADYFEDDGGWSIGSILLTTGGAYMIQWTDGSTTRYDEDEISEIVVNYATEQPLAGQYLNGESFWSLGAKNGIIILVLVFACFAYNRFLHRRRQQRFKHEN